ncbi:hypothetical protein VOLCADRAFT_43161, partial [Volvox carteri f. nagariensis]
VVVTHYDLIIRDKGLMKKVPWQVLIVDEGHRLKNRRSALFSVLSSLRPRCRLLLSGTPLQNHLAELWALLNFLMPAVFSCQQEFDDWFAAPFKVRACVLRPFLLRRTKREVASELPDKHRHIIRCPLSAWQAEQYRQISERGQLMAASGKVRMYTRALANLSVHLRKAAIHPYLLEEERGEYTHTHTHSGLGPGGERGEMAMLDYLLPKLAATGHRVLLFSQMTRALDLVEEFLELRGLPYLRLDGSTRTEDRPQLLTAFNSPNSPYRVFLLSTRAGGMGLNLQSADTVIMLDSDWNPAMDQQAEDRAHRLGQTRSVLVLVLVSCRTLEEVMLERAGAKRGLGEAVI